MIATNFDYERYYRQEVKITSESFAQLFGLCPFHDDHKASWNARKSDGIWNCFTCGFGGTIVQFHNKKYNIPLIEAEKELQKYFKTEEINPEIVEEVHKKLLNKNEVIEFLIIKRGLKNETIKKFKLGFNPEDNRIWIPISQNGKYVNIRRYDWTGQQEQKFLPFAAGMTQATTLFPYENLISAELFLMEGEMDCILANQLGYPAITVTGGANTFKKEFIPFFLNKKLRICYDIDDAGKKGTLQIVEILKNITEEIKIIELDIKTPPNGDFTDYIVTHKKTKEDFENLIRHAKILTKIGKVQILNEKPFEISLEQAAHQDNFGKRVQYNIIVVGKDLTPYSAPKQLKLTCSPSSTGKACVSCMLFHHGGNYTADFNYENINLLSLIRCADTQKRAFIKQHIGIFNRCEKVQLEVLSSWSIEEIRVIPNVDFSGLESNYIVRNIFVLSYNLETNKTYSMESIVITDPTNQYITQLVYKFLSSIVTIDQFELRDDIIERLKKFRAE